MLDLLIDKGADIHIEVNNPILSSAEGNKVEAMNFLISRGVDFNKVFNKRFKPFVTSIGIACEKAYDTTKELLDMGARLEACRTCSKKDIFLATKSYDIMELLLHRRGVSVSNLQDDEGNTRLFNPCDEKEISLLLANEADIEHKNKKLYTPIMYLCSNISAFKQDREHQLNQINWILSNNANPNARSCENITPLMYLIIRRKALNIPYEVRKSLNQIAILSYNTPMKDPDHFSRELDSFTNSKLYNYSDAIYIFKELNMLYTKCEEILESYIDKMISFYLKREIGNKRIKCSVDKNLLLARYHLHDPRLFNSLSVRNKYITLSKNIAIFLRDNTKVSKINKGLDLLSSLPNDTIYEVLKYF